MAGTITTISHCLVKDKIAYEGSKSDIVSQLIKLDIKILKGNYYVNYQIKGYYNHELGMSWSSTTWSYDEVMKELTNLMFDKLKQNGFKHYREIL